MRTLTARRCTDELRPRLPALLLGLLCPSCHPRIRQRANGQTEKIMQTWSEQEEEEEEAKCHTAPFVPCAVPAAMLLDAWKPDDVGELSRGVHK